MYKKKATGWSTQHEVLDFFLDTDEFTIPLPTRKSKELRERLAWWPWSRMTATAKEILVLAGKLYPAALVVRPGRYFVRPLLQPCGLHLNGDEFRGIGDAWGRHRKKADAEKVLYIPEP